MQSCHCGVRLLPHKAMKEQKIHPEELQADSGQRAADGGGAGAGLDGVVFLTSCFHFVVALVNLKFW